MIVYLWDWVNVPTILAKNVKSPPRYSPDGEYIAVTTPAFLNGWTVATGQRTTFNTLATTNTPLNLVFMPDGTALMALISDEGLARIDLVTGMMHPPSNLSVNEFAIHPNLPLLAIAEVSAVKNNHLHVRIIERYTVGITPCIVEGQRVAQATDGQAKRGRNCPLELFISEN